MMTVPEKPCDDQAAQAADLAAFLRCNVRSGLQVEVELSERFKAADGGTVKFLLRAVTEAENQELKRAACREKNGRVYLDRERYEAALVVASCVRPNFKSSALQADWGVVGAVDLLRKMLLAGEYERLVKEVRRVCGFDVPTESLAVDLKK